MIIFFGLGSGLVKEMGGMNAPLDVIPLAQAAPGGSRFSVRIREQPEVSYSTGVPIKEHTKRSQVNKVPGPTRKKASSQWEGYCACARPSSSKVRISFLVLFRMILEVTRI